jgi:hypothetical protein
MLTGLSCSNMLDDMITILEHQRPFTALVQVLRGAGYRYQDLSERSYGARSTAWFNNLVNSDDPWRVAPPPRATWAGLAHLFDVDEGHVQELVAQEWFSIRRSNVTNAVLGMASAINALEPDDLELLKQIARRLAGQDEAVKHDVFGFASAAQAEAAQVSTDSQGA